MKPSRHYANHQAEQHEAHHQVEKGIPHRLGFGQERLKVNCLYAVFEKGGFNGLGCLRRIAADVEEVLAGLRHILE